MAKNNFIALAKLVILLVTVTNLMEKVVAQRPTDTPFTDTSDDCDGDTSFELITGYVYSSADDIMDSKIGTLQLTECIELCQSQPQCQALNFETGLCVLFRSQAGDNSGLLAVSQFPVFTLYGQKICLSSSRPPCDSPWAYETTPGLAITNGFTADVRPASSRKDCALMCVMEDKFICRAAAWDASNNECKLAQVDRNMAGRKQLLQPDDSIDYLELACVTKPERMCEFQRFPGKILKTVDAVYQDVQSEEECKERCLNADFACYSYDFMSAGEEICRLSHHSAATLAHIQEPYLEIANATTYELQSCYQVSVECRGSEMLARISTSTLFEGKVYAKARPNSCVVDVKNTTEFEITLPYNDVNCDVVQEGPGTFSSNIVIQHHDMIVTSADIGLALHCKYLLENQTVTNSLLSGLEVRTQSDENIIEETIVISSPNVTMLVTDVLGQDIVSAQVGDNLALRFEILELDSPYEIFVRELIAMDGQDNSEILLIDEDGCPTDPTIMQQVIQVQSGKILHAPFQAFKFPASPIVQFRALVTPCLPRCEPVTCNLLGFDGARRRTSSYGRKKREVTEAYEKDIRVAQSVLITDKFQFSAIEKEDIEQELVLEGSCSSSFTSVVIACSLFLVAQLVLLMAWSYLWHKKRATKQIEPSLSQPSSLYFNGSCNTSV
ncbi:unnamed protein product, partial [Meganyctiphanes norvegica]